MDPQKHTTKPVLESKTLKCMHEVMLIKIIQLILLKIPMKCVCVCAHACAYVFVHMHTWVDVLFGFVLKIMMLQAQTFIVILKVCTYNHSNTLYFSVHFK